MPQLEKKIWNCNKRMQNVHSDLTSNLFLKNYFTQHIVYVS